MSDAPCPFCGGPTRLVARAPDRNWRVDGQVFAVRRCRRCDYGFTADPPAELGRYYTGGHYGRAAMAQDIEPFLAAEAPKLALLERFMAPGGPATDAPELMEIGPSMGAFALLASRRGFQVSAIEVDGACVAFLRDRLGLRAIQSDRPEAVLDAEGRRYHAIVLWHALEHTARPWDVLAAAARALHPGGLLLVAVPNPDSVQARLMGGRWPHYDLPRHLAHLSRSWLEARAREAGLETLHRTTRDPVSLAVNTQSVPLLLLGLAGVSAEGGRLQRLVASLCWRGGRLLARLLAPLDAREGRGAAHTFVFRRPQ